MTGLGQMTEKEVRFQCSESDAAAGEDMNMSSTVAAS